MTIKKLSFVVAGLLLGSLVYALTVKKSSDLPLVAIANYGPHSSLDAAIVGIKEELANHGFIDGTTVQYEIADIGFDLSLLPQMMGKLKNQSPKLLVVVGTPIAQFAKGTIKDIPLIYNVVTDPVDAGLIKSPHQAHENMTGSSDRQDLTVLLGFAKTLLPQAKRVGVLYATSESNDAALVHMMEQAAQQSNMSVVSLPIDQPRDIPMRMQGFKDKVDFIYVGTSGTIQPALPVIVAEAEKMGIPVLNVDEGAVNDGLVLASFGVDYRQVGKNTGKLIVQVLKGTPVSKIQPAYPSLHDHRGFISQKKATALSLSIPADLKNVEIVRP